MMPGNRRVLLFGTWVFGEVDPDLSIDYCDIQTIAYPDEYSTLPYLSSFEFVILDYSAFYNKGKESEKEQNIFEKEMLAALDAGTTFCILHYNEDVAEADNSHHPESVKAHTLTVLRRRQIGFRWLESLKVRPWRSDTPFIHAIVEREEFRMYYHRWGASHNYFQSVGDNGFDDIIFRIYEDAISGFVINYRKGRLIYLPCQRDYARPENLKECMTSLINSLITYTTRTRTELPDWGATPLFSKEAQIHAELTELKMKTAAAESSLTPYQIAKTLPFLAEYDFEDKVPEFLRTHLGWNVERNEKYKEDFWILTRKGERIVIGETKTATRGFRKSGIYDLHNHRERNGLDEEFHGLVVVNAHMNAGSWKEKLRPIDRQDYEIAAGHNILVMRIEDLLFLWNALVEERYTSEQALQMIVSNSGWLEFKADSTFVVHK